MQKRFFLLASVVLAGGAVPDVARADITGVASTEYAQSIADALAAHVADMANPHNVTKEQINLGNVPNLDTTNADNITSGTVNIARLPVVMAENTIASGADSRFDTVSTAEPTGTPPDGRVFVWFD